MSEHWEQYFTENEDQVMSILVDMNVTEKIEVEGYPVAMMVRISYENQDVNGFPTIEETQVLEPLEAHLNEHLKKHSIITPGRLTSNGIREHVYYAQQSIDKLLVSICEQLFMPKGYAVDIIEIKEKKPWDFYFNVLYPDQYEQQYIGNQWVINQLEEHGNRAEVPREITHLIYFRDTKKMRKFLKAVKKEGFVSGVGSVEVNEDGEYACTVNHTDAVELLIINSVTDYLITVSAKYEGIYDGWETSIIK